MEKLRLRAMSERDVLQADIAKVGLCCIDAVAACRLQVEDLEQAIRRDKSVLNDPIGLDQARNWPGDIAEQRIAGQ